MHRLQACLRVVESQMLMDRRLWGTPEALTLTAAVIFIFNALNARPEEGLKFKNLCDAVLPHQAIGDSDDEEEDPDDRQSAGVQACGLFFIRRLDLDGTFAVESSRVLSDEFIKRLFSKSSYEEVLDLLLPPVWRPSKVRDHPLHIPNKQVRTVTVVLDSDQPMDFDLEDTGIELPASRGLHRAPARQLGGYDHDGPVTLSKKVTQIYQQFGLDLITKFPNPTNKRGQQTELPYILVDAEARTAPFGLLGRHDVHTVLSRFAYLDCARKWAIALDCLFLPAGVALAKKAQNYPQMSFFNDYMKVKEVWEKTARGRDNLHEVRTAIIAKINDTCAWLPAADADRVWWTKTNMHNRLRQVYPKEHVGPAPIIVLNPNMASRIRDSIDAVQTPIL